MSSSAPPEVAAAAACEIVVGVGTDVDVDVSLLGPLARTVSAGLETSGRSGCMVVASAGSSEQALLRVREAVGPGLTIGAVAYEAPSPAVLRAPYHGMSGRPAAIRAVLREALARGAAACVFLDTGLTSVTPDWIARMARPVVDDGRDYVTPYYARHPFEGAITKSVVYPVFRALYAARLRQPAAAEFACSSRFMQHALDEAIWDSEEAQWGIGLWLSAAAVTGRLQIGEVGSGVRTQRPVPEAPDLTTTVGQVVGALFTDLEARANTWHRMRSSAPVPFVEEGGDLPTLPAPPVDVDQMLDAFRLGYTALRDVWAWILRPRTILHLKRLADALPAEVRVADELWAEIVYDFAMAHRARKMPRDHLLGAFTPLYLAWLAGFVTELRSRPEIDPEDRLERLCLTFEMKKPYLIAGWRWPERFRA